jgi:hypothetical protein
MATTTNYGWTTPDDTALVKDGASAIRTLGTAIDTTTFNNAAAAIAKTIVDAKGDIIAATAADTVSRLAVGANDTVLTADSTAATGLKWATPTSGGMTQLASGSLSGTAVNLTSISGSYKQLVLYVHNIYVDVATRLYMRLNTDTGSNYTYSDTKSSDAVVQFENGNTFLGLYSSTNLPTTSGENTFILTIPNYTNTAGYKPFSYVSYMKTGTATSRIGGGVYKSATAITAINFNTLSGTANFSGTYTLYGVN